MCVVVSLFYRSRGHWPNQPLCFTKAPFISLSWQSHDFNFFGQHKYHELSDFQLQTLKLSTESMNF